MFVVPGMHAVCRGGRERGTRWPLARHTQTHTGTGTERIPQHSLTHTNIKTMQTSQEYGILQSCQGDIIVTSSGVIDVVEFQEVYVCGAHAKTCK